MPTIRAPTGGLGGLSRQVWLLFAVRLLMFTFGSGSLTFIPLFARHLGASDALIGIQLAIAFAGLILGTLLAGWLADRFQIRKNLLLVIGFSGAPLYFLAAASPDPGRLFVLTVLLWFLYGAGFSITYVMGGIAAGEAVRGRVYGLLELAAALGGLASGLSFGFILDGWGFAVLFRVVALAWLLILLVALTLDDPRGEVSHGAAPGTEAAQAAAGKLARRGSSLLMASALLANVAVFTGFLTIPLSMDSAGFSGSAIASTNTAGGLILIPISFFSGSLSDRWGRKPFLIAIYLLGAAGAVMLTFATALWQFWVVTGSIYVLQTASRGVGIALLTDLLPPQKLGRGLANFQAMGWSAAVAGYAGGGYALQSLGLTATFNTGAGLCLVAALLVFGIRTRINPTSSKPSAQIP